VTTSEYLLLYVFLLVFCPVFINQPRGYLIHPGVLQFLFDFLWLSLFSPEFHISEEEIEHHTIAAVCLTSNEYDTAGNNPVHASIR
jgi:D-alanyl-lipoteichoic acid acyltransferase DltB (MBOAT superfamily)